MTQQLIEALEAELKGRFKTAVKLYKSLTDVGTELDQIGVYQNLARCREKLGEHEKAAIWHKKAAKGYLSLKEGTMSKEEREYLALVEFRSAMQDLFGNAEKLNASLKTYRGILDNAWTAQREGLTHEALVGAIIFERGRWSGWAGKYYEEVAQVLQKEKKPSAHAQSLIEACTERAWRAYQRVGDVKSMERIEKRVKGSSSEKVRAAPSKRGAKEGKRTKSSSKETEKTFASGKVHKH